MDGTISLERLSSTVLSGRYRLESKLGSGGMSTVYLALDEVLDRPVAIKLLHREISEEADQLERFRREARAAARLSHPNLVGVIDAGEDDGRPYIVFEYIEGRTLKRRIQEEGRLPVDEAVAYAIEIGRGLTAAHARKLVHRDVKPQNVLIDPDGRAKVTDFGIARSLEQKGMTATGRVLGTTDYVSPEQAMGEDVDERSDVYSLGVVLYEMLTGDVPFQRRDAGRRGDEARERADARRPGQAARGLGRGRLRRRPGDHQGPARPLRHRRRDGARPRADARGRGGPRGAGPAARRPACSTPCPSLAAPARQRRRRISGLGIAMAIVVIALIAAALIFGGRASTSATTTARAGAAAPRSGSRPTPPASSTPRGRRETGTERLAIDSNPTGTAWTTEHYDTPDFGGSRTASAWRSTPATPSRAKSMEIRSPTPGYDAQIYEASGSPPSGSPAGDSRWRRSATAAAARPSRSPASRRSRS